jgi:hypothetical protein
MRSGLIIGIVISVVIVAVFSAVAIVQFRGFPDPPTRASRPEALQPITLPGDLPPLYQPTGSDTDATRLYERAMAFYLDNKRALDDTRAGNLMKQELADLLIEAMRTSQVSRPFMDDHLPVVPGARAGNEDAFERVPELVLSWAQWQRENGREARAEQAARGVFAMGHRGFEKSVRFYYRFLGTYYMIKAWEELYALAEDNPELQDQIMPWQVPLGDLYAKLDKKAQLVNITNPNIGDLVVFATEDQDPTWRVEATLRLGLMKFKPGSRGNERAILSAIEDAKDDPHPMVQEAAHAADHLTVEEFRRIW